MTNVAPTTSTPTSSSAQALVAAATSAGASPAAASARAAARDADTIFVGAPRVKGGGGVSVKERFGTLEQRFLPEKAKGVNVKILFDLSGDGGGKWLVEIKDGKCKVTEGGGSGADVTVIAKASDYKKMAEGEMNKTMAFLRGKLKIKGDRKYLDAYETWFKKI